MRIALAWSYKIVVNTLGLPSHVKARDVLSMSRHDQTKPCRADGERNVRPTTQAARLCSMAQENWGRDCSRCVCALPGCGKRQRGAAGDRPCQLHFAFGRQ